MHDRPLVLFVPGLKPKPEPAAHRELLRRCLEAGLARVEPDVARQFAAAAADFDLVAWTYDFYGEHRDVALDAPCVEALLAKGDADARDRAEAASWRRRVLRSLHRLGDRVPFLIPHLADENVALHLRDLRRYVKNVNDVAEVTRRHLKVPLRAAAAAGRPVLLLAHSMGSVIAWDALWQLSRDPHYDGRVSLLMTLGSPLGQRYIQKRLLGRNEAGRARYPQVIDRWVNVAAVGELTALDGRLSGDFAPMLQYGLLDSLEDVQTWNWYRDHGALNVHAEYGYLANADTARYVADWWRVQHAPAGD